ncbi:MAG: 3-keto-5-aminohexanoate cleavage protein [Woeseia sp.]
MQNRHQQFAAERIMVMTAPNGARRTHSDHPALPVTADELADCAVSLADAGASVLHLHVRDDAGRHTLNPDAYRDAMRRITRQTGDALILQVTTEAVGRYTPDEQKSVVQQLRPEAASLALRELCPGDKAEPAAARFFSWLVREHIWPQYILYSVEELQRFESMRRRGVFAEEYPSCLLVLGRYTDQQAGDPAELDGLLSSVDTAGFSWTACCFGPHEHRAMLAALGQGGHVRIGFENNLLLADGSPAGDNAALVAQFTAATEQSSRRPASADEVRDAFMFR